jgi:hypothetical protein
LLRLGPSFQRFPGRLELDEWDLSHTVKVLNASRARSDQLPSILLVEPGKILKDRRNEVATPRVVRLQPCGIQCYDVARLHGRLRP